MPGRKPGRGPEGGTFRPADRRHHKHGRHRPLRGGGGDLHRPSAWGGHGLGHVDRDQHNRNRSQHWRSWHTAGRSRHHGHGPGHRWTAGRRCHVDFSRGLAAVSVFEQDKRRGERLINRQADLSFWLVYTCRFAGWGETSFRRLELLELHSENTDPWRLS